MPDDPTALDGRLVSALRLRGQRVTSQRLILHRELKEAGDHLTAEALRLRAQDALPHLSTPTVYAALELFCELGLARRVEAGGAALFEADGPEHAHLRCSVCGRIEDLDAHPAGGALSAAAAAGFDVHSAQLVLTGYCAACRLADRSPPG